MKQPSPAILQSRPKSLINRCKDIKSELVGPVGDDVFALFLPEAGAYFVCDPVIGQY